VTRELRAFATREAELIRRLCEAIVPGSARVSPEVYVDAVAAAMTRAEFDELLASLDTLAASIDDLEAVAGTAQFQQLRALACEAFYSDFVAPGAPGPGAWEEIGFSFPLADRVVKDWSFMGIGP
jgi:hypothetical protein